MGENNRIQSRARVQLVAYWLMHLEAGLVPTEDPQGDKMGG